MNRTMGRFELRRLLGEGGESAVYLAFDPRLEREVALKTLQLRGPDPARTQRLLAEARAAGKLRHPQIVPVFDAGEDAGVPFLVFEFVEGPTLAGLLQAQGALAPGRAAALVVDVLAGLEHAHGAGILHRDLKPSNILVDRAGRARVTDFGIAARVSDPAGSVDFHGTPAYMAPEYIRDNVLGPQGDVYAAGLVLYELVCGRRAIGGATLAQTLNNAVEGGITLPGDTDVDPTLAGIIGKATARDPAVRYPAAAAMREALERYLDPGDAATVPSTPGAGAGAGTGTLEFLLRRMRHRADFPALSEAISSINRLTASESENIAKLSATILKDFALTNKLLRLVNAVHYRATGAGSVSTVSRAIAVLGVNAVRSIAISLLLFEHLPDRQQATALRDEFLRANLAGYLGKRLSPGIVRDAEEAFICAMFRNLGRLLARFYFPEEASVAARDVQCNDVPEREAVQRALGISYEELGAGIARSWGLPEPIVQSMTRLPPGPLRAPTTHEGRLRTLSAFADELYVAMTAGDAATGQQNTEAVRRRFASALPVSAKELAVVIGDALGELSDFSAIIRVDLKHTPLAPLLATPAPQRLAEAGGARNLDPEFTATLLGPTAEMPSASPGTRHEPVSRHAGDAQAILAAGIQDISSTLVEDFALNDVLRIILETIYRALGLRHVLLAVRDPKSGTLVGRLGFGPDAATIAPRFRLPVGGPADVFNIALTKNVDLLIHDAADPAILPRIPAWYRETIAAPTFLLLPMSIRGVPVALVYADKAVANTIAIAERELALLRTLRNQAVLAIKQSS